MLKSSMSKVVKLFHSLLIANFLKSSLLVPFFVQSYSYHHEVKWKRKLHWNICPFLHQPRTWCCNSCQILVKLSCSSSLDIKLAATLGVYQTKIYIHTYIHSSVCMWQIKSPEMPRASFLLLTFIKVLQRILTMYRCKNMGIHHQILCKYIFI